MNKDFEENFKPLMDLSMPDEQEQKIYGKYPVLKDYPDIGSLRGVDFDTIRGKWYPDIEGKNVPCSVDVLAFQNGKIYFIEFKSGKLSHLQRKIYDSIMMLVENDNQKYCEMRQNAIYIVVAPKFKDFQNCNKAIARSTFYMNQCSTEKPWDNPAFTRLNDSWNLHSLEDVIVAKTYCMPPAMFDDFAKHEGWS